MAVVEKYKLVKVYDDRVETREFDVIRINAKEYRARVDGKQHYSGKIIPPDVIKDSFKFLVEQLNYTVHLIDDERLDNSPVPFYLITDDAPVTRTRRRRRDQGVVDVPKKRVRRNR